MITIPIIFFSYSRSAFITLFVSSLMIHFMSFAKANQWKYKVFFRITIVGLFTLVVFYLITVNQKATIQPGSQIPYNILALDKKLIQYKDVLGNRVNYFNQAYFAVQRRPILGIGPGNFEFASKAYTDYQYDFTKSAHNIFLEVLVAQGFIGIIPFIGLLLFVVIKSRKNALFYVMLGMLINFQTDYTYQIYSFLLIFFVFAGTLLEDKNLHLNALKRGLKH